MIIKIEKISGSDLPLLVKLHEMWSVDSHGNHDNCCHQLLDFKGKMHQIRFWLGLRPRTRWGNRAGGWRGEGKGGRERKEEGKGLLPRWIKNPGYGTGYIVADINVVLLIWNRIVQPVTGDAVFTDSSEMKHCKEMWDTVCAIMNDVGFSQEVLCCVDSI